jgi:hypothetical protein
LGGGGCGVLSRVRKGRSVQGALHSVTHVTTAGRYGMPARASFRLAAAASVHFFVAE